MTYRNLLPCCLILALCSCSHAEQSDNDKPVAVFINEAAGCGENTVRIYPGRIKPSEEINLSFKIAGTVRQIVVDDGQPVRKGQLIAEMDSRDYQLQYEAVEAEYKRVKAEAVRVMALYADSATTADNYDKARYGLSQMEAKYTNARNTLADTKIYSPVDGKVVSRRVDPPVVVGAGMPVVSLISSKVPEIEIHIPSGDYIRMSDIRSLSATFDFMDHDVPVRIIQSLPAANVNQLYTIRLALPPNLSPMPSPGMNATVKALFYSTEQESEVSVPIKSIFSKDKRNYVWIVQADSTIVGREVVIDRLNSDGNAILSSGLSDGESYVATGVNKLREGMKVTRQPETSDTNVGGLL